MTNFFPGEATGFRNRVPFCELGLTDANAIVMLQCAAYVPGGEKALRKQRTAL